MTNERKCPWCGEAEEWLPATRMWMPRCNCLVVRDRVAEALFTSPFKFQSWDNSSREKCLKQADDYVRARLEHDAKLRESDHE